MSRLLEFKSRIIMSTTKKKQDYPTYKITHNETEVNVEFNYLPDTTKKLDALQNHDLSMENIFQITAWKIDRYPEMNDETLKELNELKSLATINNGKTKNVLMKLLSTHGIGLPVASAYLRFINPKVYQIIDVRAFRAAYDYRLQEKGYVNVKHETQIEVYLKYLKKLRSIDENSETGYHGYRVAFENLDRFLYDFDKFIGYKLSDNPQLETTEIEKKLKEFIAKQKDQNKGGK